MTTVSSLDCFVVCCTNTEDMFPVSKNIQPSNFMHETYSVNHRLEEVSGSHLDHLSAPRRDPRMDTL